MQNGELGNADFGLHYIGLSGTDVTDEVTGLSRWRASSRSTAACGESLQFGAASTERTKVRNTIENDTNGGSCQYCNHYDVDVRESRRERRAARCRCSNFMRNGGGQLSAALRVVRRRTNI